MPLAPGMAPRDIADYTGDGAVHTLASITGVRSARWFSVQAVSVGGTAARVGSASITSTRGGVVSGGASFFMPPVGGGQDLYDLTLWYLLVQTGDTVAILIDIL